MTEDTNNPECCRRSFGDSLKDTAKRLLANPRIVPRAVARERLLICEGCSDYKTESMQCTRCQCIMPVKTTFANMRCPIDKWEEWTGEPSNED
jgi:hypothetical protein